MDNEVGRMREVVDVCLSVFISKGLFETTSRDLSKALKLQSGGLYYYFQTKDDAVIACATEAACRLENALIMPAISNISNLSEIMEQLLEKADRMAPMMKFLVQVCSTEKYIDKMKPILDGMAIRYQLYAKNAAEKLSVLVKDIEVYLYMCITAISNYMVFGEPSYIIPQLNYAEKSISELINRNT